jgi:hypothetical protein
MNIQSKSSIKILSQTFQRIHHDVSSQDQQIRLLRFQDVSIYRSAEYAKQDNEVVHDDSFELRSEEAQSSV